MFVHLVTLTALVAFVASHDVSVGVQNGGRKVYDQNITASPAIWRQVQTVFVAATDGEVIGRIAITDNRPDKNGEVRITEGGVGEKNVTIELKSPTVFRGLDFSVDVYSISEEEYLRNETENPQTINHKTEVDVPSTEKPEMSTEKVPVTVKSASKVPEPHKDDEVKVPAIAGIDTIDVTKEIPEGSGDSNIDTLIGSIFSSSTSGPMVKTYKSPPVVTENLPFNPPAVAKEPDMPHLPVANGHNPVVPSVGVKQ